MPTFKELLSRGFSRRESLKLSGLALGGLALGGKAAADCVEPTTPCYPSPFPTQTYTYFEHLPVLRYDEGTYPALLPNEMRISFMGSCIPPTRRAQAMMSVFVEVGGGPAGTASDQAVFDCGSGVCANYDAMDVGFGRMDKVFLAHLHGDHMNDLTHIYCFGPSTDRKHPLYVWGQSPSGVKNPARSPKYYADGTRNYCKHLREACRWHTESFSFEKTGTTNYDAPTMDSWGLPEPLVQVGDDPPDDGYALYPIELDWRKTGVAYHNQKTGVKITHFPVIHTRQGSMGYKVEWNGLSMIYTSDTKPELNTIVHASHGGKGVDVLVHEMAPAPEVWAMKMLGRTKPGTDPLFLSVLQDTQTVQSSSHTPQGAFGYLLSQIYPRPGLTVATHFPVSDDTVQCALESVKRHCPDIVENGPKLTWSFDRMVIRVFAPTMPGEKVKIVQMKAQVLEYGFSPFPRIVGEDLATSKYHDRKGEPDPYAQIDMSTAILPGPDTFCEDGY